MVKYVCVFIVDNDQCRAELNHHHPLQAAIVCAAWHPLHVVLVKDVPIPLTVTLTTYFQRKFLPNGSNSTNLRCVKSVYCIIEAYHAHPVFFCPFKHKSVERLVFKEDNVLTTLHTLKIMSLSPCWASASLFLSIELLRHYPTSIHHTGPILLYMIQNMPFFVIYHTIRCLFNHCH